MLKEGGLHFRGLARLLGCRDDLIIDTATRLKGVGLIEILDVEIVTAGGIQAARLLTGLALSRVLEAIVFSKAKRETKAAAMQIMKRLATAGFKLAVMLELAPEQLLEQTKAAQPASKALPAQLRPDLLAVEVSESIVKISNNLPNSPRLAQILIDSAMNAIVDHHQLPAAEFPADKWYGLVQIADKMGITTNSSTRIRLGQFVAKFDLERVRESRLCHGQMMEIWCYRDDEATRSAINEWVASAAL